MKLLHQSFDVPIYDAWIVLLYGPFEQANVYMKKRFSLESVIDRSNRARSWQTTDSKDRIAYVLWVGSSPKRDEMTLCNICHETLHIAHFILQTVGVRITNQEAVSYLQEYLFRECWKRIRRS